MSIALLDKIYLVVQLASAILLVVAILMQRQATTISGAFGGGESTHFHTRRGAEKFLFQLTIFLAIVLFASTIGRDILR